MDAGPEEDANADSDEDDDEEIDDPEPMCSRPFWGRFFESVTAKSLGTYTFIHTSFKYIVG
jgi:hypothetical protein